MSEIQIIITVGLIALLIGLILGHQLKPKKQTFQPDLIDLKKYEMQLLYAREHDQKVGPIKPIPNVGKWTDSELQYMRVNRAEAKEIYDRVWEER